MVSDIVHTGGCLCGQVRYEVRGEPLLNGICHCRYCQCRTGSAFGVNIYFHKSKVRIVSGEVKSFSFQTESDHYFLTEFCINCGSTVFLKPELAGGNIGIAAGTFDPPTFWCTPSVEVFTRTKANFFETEISKRYETTKYHQEVNIDDPSKRGSGGA